MVIYFMVVFVAAIHASPVKKANPEVQLIRTCTPRAESDVIISHPWKTLTDAKLGRFASKATQFNITSASSAELLDLLNKRPERRVWTHVARQVTPDDLMTGKFIGKILDLDLNVEKEHHQVAQTREIFNRIFDVYAFYGKKYADEMDLKDFPVEIEACAINCRGVKETCMTLKMYY